MKKINLEEILANKSPNYKLGMTVGRQSYTTVRGDQAIEAMKEAVKQALELAAENAEAKGEGSSLSTKSDNLHWTFAGHIGKVVIDKSSIINTINQIE